MQLVGQAALPAAHKNGLQLGLPGLPAPAKVHVPVAQVSQAPEQALSQHLPLEQKPLEHSSALPQSWPCFLPQLPAPSHTLLPVQAGVALASGVSFATFVVQVPAAFAHDLQAALQGSAQQRPSTQ